MVWLIEKEKQLQAELAITRYEVINMTEHEVVLYSSYDGNTFQQFGYSAPKNSSDFTCSKKKTIIAAIPFVEVVDGDSVNAKRVIMVDPQTHELPYTCFFNMAMKDFDGTAIVFDKKYEPPKSELDQWKEYGLKSFYLLKQIEMMTEQMKIEMYQKKSSSIFAPRYDKRYPHTRVMPRSR